MNCDEDNMDHSYDDLISNQIRYDRERVNLCIILDMIKHRSMFEPYFESINEVRWLLLDKIKIVEIKIEEYTNKIKNFDKKDEEISHINNIGEINDRK